MFDLQEWLRRSPQPASLRVKTSEGEERNIKLPVGRKRWATIAETVRTNAAVSVQCLDPKGEVIRGKELSEDELDGDTTSTDLAARDEKTAAKSMLAMAAMLDRAGMRQNEAFEMGAKAAGESSQVLIELVRELCTHLSVAITNLHNVSVNLGNALSANGSDEGGNPKLLESITAIVAASVASQNGKGASK